MKALILMTRIPIPGKTKTRLMDIFSDIECAGIHKAFLLDLFNLFDYIKNDIDIFLTYTPEDRFNVIEDMLPDYIETFPQRGEDLGKRMENAIGDVLNKGYSSVILIGSDIPDIQKEDIYHAFQQLEENHICLGPTFDGGYYLIGMKKLYRELFDNSLKWGKKSVLEGTIDIANNKGLSVGLAAKHIDIDTKEDLFNFINRVEKGELSGENVPINTIRYLQKHWSGSNYA